MSKEAFYSLTPINWLLRSIALSSIYREGSQLADSGSITKSAIYIITFGVLNIFCFYHKMKTFDGNLKTGVVRFSDSIKMTYWFSYIEYIVDMYFVLKYGRLLLLTYFKAYGHIDLILGVPSSDEIRKTIIGTLIFSVSAFTSVSVFDCICWVIIEGWEFATICSVDYLYFFLSMLTILDILSHVIQVEYRLKIIRELLEKCSAPNTIESSNKDSSTISVRPNNDMGLKSLNMLCSTKYFETTWYIKCYLLLLEQVTFINTSYGCRVLAYCVNLLINMINLLNLAIRIFNGSMQATYASGILNFLSSVSSAMRALNYYLMMIILMYRCEQVYKQSDMLLETIDILVTSENSCSSLKNDFLEFRNLIITRPVKFHAAKFFTMDYTVLVSLISVVVTYTIIMLQSVQ